MAESKTDALPLGDEAYRRIRGDILSCRLQPGQRFTERAMAARMDMSVSPIRDALTRLDHEGLVRTAPRTGYQVTPLTIKSVDSLFDYWGILGVEMARRAVAGANDEQIELLVESIVELAQISTEGEGTREAALRWGELASRPFEIAAKIIDNDYIVSAYQQLSGQIKRVWILVIDSELLAAGRRVDSYDDAIRAIRARDVEAFAKFMRDHIEQSHVRVLRTLARWPSVITAEVVPLQAAST